jgi:hypothetical protein
MGVILKDRNLELIRSVDEMTLKVELVVYGWWGGWAKNVVLIIPKDRYVRYYYVHNNYNGSGSETFTEKIVSERKLEEIVEKALKVQTLRDFDELTEIVMQA